MEDRGTAADNGREQVGKMESSFETESQGNIGEQRPRRETTETIGSIDTFVLTRWSRYPWYCWGGTPLPRPHYSSICEVKGEKYYNV